MQGDEGLTQEQMRNASIAGLALEIGELRRALNEQAAMIEALHRVFLEKQPGHADTLADRLLKEDRERMAAEIMAEKVQRKSALVGALTLLGASVLGGFVWLMKMTGYGAPQ